MLEVECEQRSLSRDVPLVGASEQSRRPEALTRASLKSSLAIRSQRGSDATIKVAIATANAI